MSKLILVLNPVTNEQIEFVSSETSLTGLFTKFLVLHPQYKDVLKDQKHSIRLNDKKIDDDLEKAKELVLADSDTIIVYPDIEDPFTIVSMIAMMVDVAITSAVGYVTGATVGTMGAYGAGAGMMAGNAGIAGSGATGATATAGATAGGSGLGAAIGSVVGSAAMNQMTMASRELMASHKPSMSGGSSEPGEGSPTYGWNVRPTAAEGIPVPVIYGKHKVGGNMLSSTTESIPEFLFDWFEPKDSGCSLMVLPIPPVRCFNGGIVGLWPPVKGVYCKLNPRVPFYAFFSWKLFSWGDLKKILNQLVLLRYFRTGSDGYTFQDFVNRIKDGLTSINNRRFNNNFGSDEEGINLFSNRWEKFTNGWKNNVVSSITQSDIENITGNNEAVILDGDFGSDNFGKEIFRLIRDKIDRSRLTFEVINTWLAGNEYGKTFESENLSRDNLGIYFVGCLVGCLESLKKDQWWISDIMCETTPGFTYELGPYSLYGPKLASSEEQHLHQLIAVSEGECVGVENVFVNDNPILDYPGTAWFFLNGTNTQTVDAHNKNGIKIDYYNNTTSSHARAVTLDTAGDYAEFITTQGFAANNVHIRCAFLASRITTKGKLSDLADHPIKFIIIAGYEDTVNMDGMNVASYRDIDDIDLLGRNATGWVYEMYGGSRDAIYKKYTTFPIMDILNIAVDVATASFPFGIKGVAALYGLYGSINWSRYETDEDYKQEVWDLLRSEYNSVYLKNQKRIRVRILRVSPPTGNNRYTEKMTVVGFDEVSYAGYNYPNTAALGIKIRATEQLHGGQPKITSIIKGKKIRVPKLVLQALVQNKVTGVYEEQQVYHEFAWYDEDIKCYRSMYHAGAKCKYDTDSAGKTVWSTEYSNNPIWCLYDLLTNDRYGLGAYIDECDLDLDQYKAMAQHCDEMVPNAVYREALTITEHRLIDNDTDFFDKDKRTYDDESGQWINEITDEVRDNLFYKWKDLVTYGCIFAKTYDGTWTRAVIGNADRLLLSTYFYLGVGATASNRGEKPYVDRSTSTNRTSYWTNGLPDGSSKEYRLGEKRFMLDYVMDDRSGAMDYIKQICDTFRCYPIWMNGVIYPVIDKYTTPVAVFGMGNIIKDSFSMTYSSLNETPNMLECQFANEDNYYEKDSMSYIDSDVDVATITDITKKLRKKSVKLLGITRRSQILRELKYKLESYKLPKTISFRTGIENINITAGDVFRFTHDILVDAGYSGKILGYDTDTYEIIVDQDLSALSLPLRLQIKTTTPASSSVDATEGTLELTVTSVSGNRIKAGFESLGAYTLPEKYDNYAIGSVDEITELYRAITVTPSYEGEVEIIAFQYNPDVLGDERVLVNGGYTYYNAEILDYQDGFRNPLPILFATKPVSELSVYPDTTGRRVMVSFAPPLIAPKYVGSRIELKIGSGLWQTCIERTERQDKEYVCPFDVPIDVVCSVRVTALYRQDLLGSDTNYQESLPVTGDIVLALFNSGDTGDNPDFTPVAPTNLRLAKVCRTSAGTKGWMDESKTEFRTKFIKVKWDRVDTGFSNNLFQAENEGVANYTITIEKYVNSWISIDTREVHHLLNHFKIDAEELGVNKRTDLENISQVRFRVWTRGTNGRLSNDYAELVVTPKAPNPPTYVRVFPMYTGVFVRWKKHPDWDDIEKFNVTLYGFANGKIPLADYSNYSLKKESVSEGDYWEFFEITLDERRSAFNLSNLNLFGVMAGVKWRAVIEPFTSYGARSASIESFDSDIPQGGQTEELKIPDWMLDAVNTNITVYDNLNHFGNPIDIDNMRKERPVYYGSFSSYNYSAYDVRQNLIDNDLGSGITYSGLAWTALNYRCIRISYELAQETEFRKVYFTVDKACRIWVEYSEKNSVTGSYTLGANWRRLGGDSNNELNNGTTMIQLSSNVFDAVEDANQRGLYWEVEAGDNIALFPFSLQTRFIRLLVSPIGSSTVTISEVRFCRNIVADEIYTSYLSSIVADMGELTAGEILFNCTRSGTTLTVTDALRGGMWLGAPEGGDITGFAQINKYSQLTTWLDAETGLAAFQPPNSQVPIVIPDEYDDSHIWSAVDGLAAVVRIIGDGYGLSIGPSGGSDEIRMGRSSDGLTSGIDILSSGNINIATGGNLNLTGGNINITASANLALAAGQNLTVTGSDSVIIAGAILRMHTGGHFYIGSGIGDNTFDFDVANETLTVGSTIVIDGPNETINIGNTIILDAPEEKITIGSNIILDGENKKITVGLGDESISIKGDGGDLSYIRSGNFQSSNILGQGKGFELRASGSLELNDVTVRGAIKGTTMVNDEINACGGELIVTEATVLAHDIDDDDTRMFFEHDAGFLDDTWIQVKQKSRWEIMKVNNVCKWYEDASPSARTITPINTPTKSTDYYVFGNSSAKFVKSSSQYMYCADSDDWDFGSGDFTVEARVRFSSFSEGYLYHIVGEYSAVESCWILYTQTSSGLTRILFYAGNVTQVISLSSPYGSVTTDTWYDISVVRNGTIFTLYIDGEVVSSGSTSSAMPNVGSGAVLQVGGHSSIGFLDGYIDELRISKGIARYTESYDISTERFIPDSYTVLLLHFDLGLYDITRNADAAGAYAWKKGQAFVGLGAATSDGWLVLDSQSPNSPYMDVIQRTDTAAYDDYEMNVRVGNLAGVTDDDFGALSGFGIYADRGYFKGNIYIGGSETSNALYVSSTAANDADIRFGSWAAGVFTTASKITVDNDTIDHLGILPGTNDNGRLMLGNQNLTWDDIYLTALTDIQYGGPNYPQQDFKSTGVSFESSGDNVGNWLVGNSRYYNTIGLNATAVNINTGTLTINGASTESTVYIKANENINFYPNSTSDILQIGSLTTNFWGNIYLNTIGTFQVNLSESTYPACVMNSSGLTLFFSGNNYIQTNANGVTISALDTGDDILLNVADNLTINTGATINAKIASTNYFVLSTTASTLLHNANNYISIYGSGILISAKDSGDNVVLDAADQVQLKGFNLVFYLDGTERTRWDSGGTITHTGDFWPKTTNTYNLGSSSLCWNYIYRSNEASCCDIRFKDDIVPENSLGLEFIKALNPIKFMYNSEKTLPENKRRKRLGLSAQDVYQICKRFNTKEFVLYDEEEDKYFLLMDDFIVPLINSIKQLDAEIKQLKKEKTQ